MVTIETVAIETPKAAKVDVKNRPELLKAYATAMRAYIIDGAERDVVSIESQIAAEFTPREASRLEAEAINLAQGFRKDGSERNGTPA